MLRSSRITLEEVNAAFDLLARGEVARQVIRFQRRSATRDAADSFASVFRKLIARREDVDLLLFAPSFPSTAH